MARPRRRYSEPVTVANDAAVNKAIKRATNEARELVKDLATPEKPKYPPIRIYPDPILSTVCQPVLAPQVPKKWVGEIFDQMILAMTAEGGIGLAANQIGYTHRMIVLKTVGYGLLKLVNPRITGRNGIRVPTDERCLSVPGIAMRKFRSASVSVHGYNPDDGTAKTYHLKGMEAACVQHEIQHLDGKTILDQ